MDAWSFFVSQLPYIVYFGLTLAVLIVVIYFSTRIGMWGAVPIGLAVALLVFVVYCILWWHYPLDWFTSRAEWLAWFLFRGIVEAIPD